MRRITKRQAKKLFSEGKVFIVCPCKMFPVGPWSVGCNIHPKEYLEDAARYEKHPDLWKGSLEETAWSLMYNNWCFYNTNYEMGYYAHYYIL
jgi:hypothetical protein